MRKVTKMAIIAAISLGMLSGCSTSQYAKQSVQNQTYQYKEIKQMVEDFQKKADQTVPKKGTTARAKQYAALKAEEKKIENALETYEDDLEYQLESGTMTREDYNRKDSKLEALEDRLDLIEDQLEVLFKSSQAGKETGTNRSSGNIVKAAGTAVRYTDLKQQVQAFQKKADKVKPKGTRSQQAKQYSQLKTEIKKIEKALDQYEDRLEYKYKSGSLARSDYKRKEQKLELLEDQLDLAEDQLEYLFGIDD